MKYSIRVVAFALILTAVALLASSASALVILPDPTVLINGIPLAIKYDDFWSFDNQIMMAIQKQTPSYLPVATYGDFSFSTGTGGLDVILYTGAGTKDRNQAVGPNTGGTPKGDFFFEDPVSAPTGGGTTLDGFWGQSDQNNNGTPEAVNGPVTVGQVLNYLHAFNPNFNIPVFYLDNNQIGAASSLLISGQVYLYDVGADGIKGTVDDGGVKYVWALDTIPQPGDGLYDHDAQALATGQILNLTGADGHNYGTIDNNVGSGQADFIGYVPTMDLSKFNPNWLFVTEFNLGGLNDGFEEIFLTGAIAPQQEVPEPSSIVLLSAGLLGVLSIGRRKNRK